MHEPSIPSRALALLERTRPDARAVATDADGTLWTADSGDALYVSVLERQDASPAALDYLRREAVDRRLVEPSATGYDAGHALRRAWLAGVIDDKVNCDIQARAIGGRSRASFDACCDAVVAEVSATVRGDVRELLVRAASLGARITVVTASLARVVEVSLAAARIPFDCVAGARLRTVGDHIDVELDGLVPMFDEKVRALRAQPRWPATIGMGDGHWDAEFLRETSLAILVHPREGLVRAMSGTAKTVTWTPDGPEST